MSRLLDRLYHLHAVAPGVWRSAQPYLGFYKAYLAGHGMRAILNLRGPNPRHGWWRNEKSVAASQGIAHFDVKLSSRKIPQRADLAALFDIFDSAPTPLLIKCSGGQDRTSFVAALYLLHRGASPEDADAQFAFWPYLHRPKKAQRWLRQFPRFALEDAGARSLKDWAHEAYDPQRFTAWLAARGMGDFYREIQREWPRKKS